MNVTTIITNLNNTIAGKQLLLAQYEVDLRMSSMAEGAVIEILSKFLRINIVELTRIRDDLVEVSK